MNNLVKHNLDIYVDIGKGILLKDIRLHIQFSVFCNYYNGLIVRISIISI